MRCPNCDGPIYTSDLLSGLSPRHRAALELFIAKFLKGAQEHGDLVAGKDWTSDMLDEQVDMAFYTIFQLLDLLGGDKSGS